MKTTVQRSSLHHILAALVLILGVFSGTWAASGQHASGERRATHTPAGTFTVLYSFPAGGKRDAESPEAALIPGASGTLYGTTGYGGGFDKGTVFGLDKNGNETVLHRFRGSDGYQPSGLVRDSAGNLYGTTGFGGDATCDPAEPGCGVIFKLTKTGKFALLHVFTGRADGDGPYAALLFDKSGTLYGTTYFGGVPCPDKLGCGTVYKLEKSGKLSILYNFTGTAGDGWGPVGKLVQDKQGNLYGLTFQGGDFTCQPQVGCGTVFKLDTNGKESILYSFTGRNGDGISPSGDLLLDSAGNLYGTTRSGGAGGGFGTVFKLDKNGKETVLHSFAGYPGDGGAPFNAGVVRDSKGNLYGTTASGGDGCPPVGCGTVFELAPNGKETVLHNFADGADGREPFAGLLLDGAGNLYGTAFEGGIYGAGTVFKLTP